jgi:hypothetical protein
MKEKKATFWMIGRISFDLPVEEDCEADAKLWVGENLEHA